jgi:cytochrome c556
MAFAAVALLGTGVAVAQDKMAAVEQRKALMKLNGASAGKIAAFLQKGEGTTADVATAAGTIADDAKKLPSLWPDGTSTADMPGQTRAKPELFQNKQKAVQYLTILGEKAAALQTAAKAGNKEAIQAAFGAMNREACGACHNDFRAPQQR